jgi:hypothetical protein
VSDTFRTEYQIEWCFGLSPALHRQVVDSLELAEQLVRIRKGMRGNRQVRIAATRQVGEWTPYEGETK